MEDIERLRNILSLYLADEMNLFDEQGRYKTYAHVIKDFKGLISKRTIRKLLSEEYPELAEAMTTKQKQHHMKY
jgi:hypothetical protein